MKRLRATIVFEYDADPEFYDTDNPQRMACIDQQHLIEHRELALDLAARNEFTVKVEPAGEGNVPGPVRQHFSPLFKYYT